MWTNLDVDNDYEIYSDFPYQIRKKSNKKILKEGVANNGYLRVSLNQKQYSKHRLIAEAFIPNPDELPCVDHINRNKFDNRLENLRFVSSSDNSKNRSGRNEIIYDYVDKIPNDSIVVDFYGDHDIEDYYFYDNVFYFYNGINFRKLHINENRRGYKYVNMINTEGIKIACCYSKFKREHDLI